MDNYKDVLSFFETIDDLMMVVSLEGSVLYVNSDLYPFCLTQES